MNIVVLLIIINLFRIISSSLTKVADGQEVEDKSLYPYIVAVNLADHITRTHCGGTILKHTWIMTAAHCVVDRYDRVYNTDQIVIIITLLDFQDLKKPMNKHKYTYDVREFFIHPRYDPHTVVNDIALIELEEPIRFDEDNHEVTLPEVHCEPHKMYDECQVLGWGDFYDEEDAHSHTLHVVTVPLTDNDKCRRLLGNNVGKITDDHVCSFYAGGGRGACFGDSGGPLMCARRQVGIVSWATSCTEPGSPVVYVRVDKYLDWIYDLIDYDIGNTMKNDVLLIYLLFFILTSIL